MDKKNRQITVKHSSQRHRFMPTAVIHQADLITTVTGSLINMAVRSPPGEKEAPFPLSHWVPSTRELARKSGDITQLSETRLE